MAIFLANPNLAEGNHYRWKNERGETVYSDRTPPPGTDYEIVSTSSTFSRNIDAEEGAVSADDEGETPTVEVKSKKNPEICLRAETNLNTLREGGKISVRDANGDTRILTDQEVRLEMEKAKSRIEVYCE